MSKQGKKTMTLSLLIGIPGPIVTAIGMIIGKSTTQFADFIRRAIELLAIISSFIIYNKTTKDNHYNLEKKEKLEKVSNKVVAITMIICGLIMLILGLITQNEEKGNVIPGLIISIKEMRNVNKETKVILGLVFSIICLVISVAIHILNTIALMNEII